ncbi:unnamed protein product, partial [marine sediment metagenome]
LIILSLSILLGTVSAEQKKEDMDKSIGDKWEYRFTAITENMTMVFTMSIEITGETVVEINGVNYDVFEAVLDGNIESCTLPSTPGVTLTLIEDYGLIDGTIYFTKNIFNETSKMIQNMEFILNCEELDLEMNFDITSVTILTVTSGESPDIIDIGTSWVLTAQSEKTTTTTVYGSFYDTFYEEGYTNTTTETESDIQTTNYECIGEKTITTPAGTFETYEIRKSEVQLGEETYSLLYASDMVSGMVKSIDYDSEGSIIGVMELISYDVGSGSSSSSQDKTPGF